MTAGDWLGPRVAGARFRVVRMREGYAMGDVDAFLDQLVAAAAAGQPVRSLVDQARFSPVRMREGYDMGDVDRFLDEVKAADPVDPTAAPAQPPAPPPVEPPVAAPPTSPTSPASSPTSDPAPLAVQEQRGLWSRLLGRR